MEPGRRVAVLLNKELRAVVGIVLSLGLLRLYRRLTPEPEVRGRVAGIALVASLMAGIAGYFVHAAIMVGIGLQPSFEMFLDATTEPRSILELVFAFLVWSAAYFGVLIWHARRSVSGKPWKLGVSLRRRSCRCSRTSSTRTSCSTR
jgi:hypothetical protein